MNEVCVCQGHENKKIMWKKMTGENTCALMSIKCEKCNVYILHVTFM